MISTCALAVASKSRASRDAEMLGSLPSQPPRKLTCKSQARGLRFFVAAGCGVWPGTRAGQRFVSAIAEACICRKGGRICDANQLVGGDGASVPGPWPRLQEAQVRAASCVWPGHKIPERHCPSQRTVAPAGQGSAVLSPT
eukprot:scaffold999_cov375-Prasinococcus_capsulatus_cf.AAC.4